MAEAAEKPTDFSEMDNAGVSKGHWKIMFISGMGVFTDAYDLFIIGVVMVLIKPIWHVDKVEEGLVESTALLASAIGALLFGRVADMIGRFWRRPVMQSPRLRWINWVARPSRYWVSPLWALHSDCSPSFLISKS